MNEAIGRNADFVASELRYRRLFETAHDGILIVDPLTRRIIDVNPFLRQFLGYTTAEVLGRELWEIGLPEDAATSRAAFDLLLVNTHIRYEDLPLQTKDGRTMDVEFVSNLYQEGAHRVIQCNIRDIRARKQAEQSQRDAAALDARHAAELDVLITRRTAELRQSNVQLETFVYSIAHDLRAPLRAMQGFAQLLVQDHSATLSPAGRDYAVYINTAAQTMDRLLADLLAFSQLSQQEVELTPLSLESSVRATLAACAGEIQASGARVTASPPWPAVLAHAATLQQVLVNLIGNAVKFGAGRETEVVLRAEERPRGMVRVWVEDNGIGIPAEFQQRIFQVFQRLHTTAYPGTGLGLAIVQKGVERMGGHVGVESSPGTGSSFWIDLARAPGAESFPEVRHAI